MMYSVYMNLVSNTGIKTDAAKDIKITKGNVKFNIYSIYYVNNKKFSNGRIYKKNT
jgi:hypothetical protein